MSNKVMISVIMATYNRSNILNETLSHFLSLDSSDLIYEIIVVDNNSSDNTEEVIKDYSKKLSIVYVLEKRQGKNFALNTALDMISGDIVVFTDDDVTPQENWLKEITKTTIRWPSVNIFGGRVIPVFPEGADPRIIDSSFSDFMFTDHNPFPKEGIYPTYPVGANCWIRRSVFQSGEKFNVEMGPNGKERISGGEIEFFHRLAQKGEKIVFAPSVVVEHRIQKSQFAIKYLIKRSIAGGRGWVRIRDPFSDCAFLLGTPRFLFRLMIQSLLKVPFYFAIGKNYLEPGMKFFEYIGCVYEYKLLNKKSK